MTNKTQKFINKAIVIHGNAYDYSNVEYINARDKIIIICSIHGKFEQTPSNHLQGKGCKKCAIQLNAKTVSSNTNKFIDSALKLHGLTYDYSKVKYINNHTKIKIICPIHGEFEQTPGNHLQGRGCKYCNTSKGELKIKKVLSEYNMAFYEQHKFKNCKNERTLPFDFYIETLNLCIEYDGEQHFESIEFFGGEEAFYRRQLCDEIKNQYCNDNNINLLRIRYDEDHVSVLKEYFKSNFNIEL